jgi:hypothetical protein
MGCGAPRLCNAPCETHDIGIVMHFSGPVAAAAQMDRLRLLATIAGPNRPTYHRPDGSQINGDAAPVIDCRHGDTPRALVGLDWCRGAGIGGRHN